MKDLLAFRPPGQSTQLLLQPVCRPFRHAADIGSGITLHFAEPGQGYARNMRYMSDCPGASPAEAEQPAS